MECFYLFDVLFRVHRAAAGASKPRRTIERKFLVPFTRETFADRKIDFRSGKLLSIFRKTRRNVRRSARFSNHFLRGHFIYTARGHLSLEIAFSVRVGRRVSRRKMNSRHLLWFNRAIPRVVEFVSFILRTRCFKLN